MMRVLLVDAFPMSRAAVVGLLKQQFTGACARGADTAAAARAALAADRYDLMLLDLRMDGGLELLQQLPQGPEAMPTVVISGSDAPEDVLRAIDAGAMGYVSERSDLKTLAHVMRLVLAGGTFVPTVKAASGDAVAASVVVADWGQLPLTPRQKDVLRLLTQGLPNKLIARELGVSVETVKDHVAAVLEALGVSSRTQAVVVATQKTRGA